MGEVTTLTWATKGKESLRTTVPMSIVKHFKLKAGNKLDWDFEARNNELVIKVCPLRDSNEKETIPTENSNRAKIAPPWR